MPANKHTNTHIFFCFCFLFCGFFKKKVPMAGAAVLKSHFVAKVDLQNKMHKYKI